MFYFRINRIKVVDNREEFFFFDVPAQVRIMSFVSTGNEQLPDMTEFMATDDQGRKREILANAVQKIAAARILTEIDQVPDNHVLTFGDLPPVVVP